MPKPVQKLRLNTLKNCQKTLARLCRDFHENGSADNARARTLAYMIRILIESFQFDRKTDIDERLDEIERRINANAT